MLLLAVALPAAAQYYFSKNKVQTRPYDFKTLPTEHFTIFYYTGGEVLADYTARIAEEFHDRLSQDLGISGDGRIPIIIYNSPNHFAETNVVLEMIDEGVGGFSELFKNRVVMPFDGSYARFKKVLWHEITHIFEFEIFYRPRLASVLSLVQEFQIPLWVAEGLAEFASGNVEIGNEVFMRDLVINNRLLPIDKLNDFYGYLSYRQGEAVFRYIEERYGRKKVFEFVHQLKSTRSVNEAFVKTFGLSTGKFSDEFEAALRKRYWPEIVRDGNFAEIGRRLTNHVEDGSVYNTSPAISPSGSLVAFISDRKEYADVYVVSALDGRVLTRLVRGERSGGFESVHPYRGGISWAPDETAIVIAAKARGRDVLTVVEYPSGRVRRRWFLKLDAIMSPRYSPDGSEIVLVGLKDGVSDIYRLTVATGELQRVTADIYEDRDPTYSPGGDTILFVSDRPGAEEWQPGAYALFLATGHAAVEQVTERTDYLAHPAYLPDGDKLAFVTADSSYDLCIYSLAERRVIRRSNFLGGVYYPDFSKDGSRLIISYYENLGWDISSIRDPLAGLPAARTGDLAAPGDTARYERNEPGPERIRPYRFTLTPDYAVGLASYSSGTGVAGHIDLAFSDVLGNHRFFLTTDLLGDILNSDFDLQYWNFKGRTDFGIGVFQSFDYGYADYPRQIVQRRNLGLTGLASYPIDKYNRFELGPQAIVSQYQWATYRSDEDAFVLDSTRWRRQFLLDGAYVFDNTYWGTMTAPERGVRLRFEAYGPVGLSDFSYLTAFVDARGYLKPARRFVVAGRLIGFAGFGLDAQRYYLGGEDVRGYQYAEFYRRQGTRAAVLNTELRFPFVDRLKLAFPLPVEVRDLRGVVFADAGTVWDAHSPWLYDTRRRRLEDLKVGAGAGLRLQISYFALKLDWGWPFSSLSRDSETGPERKRRGTWYFSIGTDF